MPILVDLRQTVRRRFEQPHPVEPTEFEQTRDRSSVRLSSQYSRFLHKPVEAKGSSGDVTGEGKLMRQSGVSCLSPARMVFVSTTRT